MGDIDEASRHFFENPIPAMGTQSSKYSNENPAWKCRHESGPCVRNLIVCIDGTANQFGQKNTNVIELYNLIRKEVGYKQLTWYNSGIGTYARPSWKSLKYYRKVIDHKIDLAIAWNFERTILAAYRWLSENYQEGDRIFLFGFSRGAFQVRVLAAMIDKVGLIHKGNEEQIPFAYELYADPKSGAPSSSVANVGSDTEQKRPRSVHGLKQSMTEGCISMAARFKRTFSHEKADVHYVGVWDTVSSIGLARGKYMLPGTVDGMKHVCYFRHALALDERRVKFAPEYAYGGLATLQPNAGVTKETVQPTQKHEILMGDAPPQTLEVWFAGTHSDIGGGNVLNEAMDRSRPPLRWMVFESAAAGLRTKPFQRVLSATEQIEVKESLTGVWWILECLPLNRLTYTRRKDGEQTTHRPHLGAPRKIHAGQKIHGSLILTNKGRNEYTPKARPLEDDPNFWTNSCTKGLGDWKAVDLFEGTQDLMNRFVAQQDESVWELLRRTAMTVDGRQAVYEGAVAALQSTFTTPKVALSIKIGLILNVMDILEQTERKDSPLRKFDLENLWAIIDDCRASNNERYITVARTFLRRFTTYSPLCEIPGHRWAIPSVAIFPNGTRIVSGLLDSTIRVWDPMTGTSMGERIQGHTDVVNVVVVSPNGRFILSGSRDGTVRLWNAETGVSVTGPFEGHTEPIRSLAFSPDGNWAASGSEDNTIRIWDVNRGAQVGEPLRGHRSIVYAVEFFGSGRHIVSCSIDRTVRFWDVKTHQPVAEPLHLGRDEEWLLSVAFSSDGKLVAAGFSDESVRVWDLEKRKMVGKPFRMHRGVVCSAAFSPDSRKVVSGSIDGTVLVWDAETKKLENVFQHRNWVRSVAFFPDGKNVVSGCDDGIIRIWGTEPW